MDLFRALRLDSNKQNPVINFAGAGGKTTAMFQLAHELAKKQLVIVTATTHLGAWQISHADHHIISIGTNIDLPTKGVLLVTGEIENERTRSIEVKTLNWLHEVSKNQGIPLLIEADGSRQKPLKAPAEHEPPVPDFSNMVIYIAGLGAFGKPLHENHVHRAEIFSQLSGLSLGETITPQAMINVLTHPQGGLKNIPQNAKRIALLNQADAPELKSIGGSMARDLLPRFDSVIVGSLQEESFQTIERTAGIILAAGQATRYGSPKQLLDWKGKPFVRQVAETALLAGLEPVLVITGFHHAEVESCLRDLFVKIIHNVEYELGQSTSIKAGISSLPKDVSSAVFLLADQPQIPVEVIRALIESHASELQPILAPLVLGERRANPVLFDQVTFPSLMQLTGDIGGRGIFDKHPVSYLPWHDDLILFDVDKPEDYERLKDLE